MKKLLILIAILSLATMASAATIKLRGDTAANWTSANPTLAEREIGLETDTRKMKIGDGGTAWTGLSYTAGGESVASTTSLEYVYYDASATDTGYKHRVVDSQSWTKAYSWCDAAESSLVYTIYYSATLGGTFSSIGTVSHNSAATTDTIDISAFTDPTAGGWLRVDITTPATSATECTLVLELQ